MIPLILGRTRQSPHSASHRRHLPAFHVDYPCHVGGETDGQGANGGEGIGAGHAHDACLLRAGRLPHMPRVIRFTPSPARVRAIRWIREEVWQVWRMGFMNAPPGR